MAYSYDRIAASIVPRLAKALKAKATKAMQTYAKASGTLEDLRKSITSLQPSFNTMSGKGELEQELNNLYNELRVATDEARVLSQKLTSIYHRASAIEEKASASGL